MYSKRYSILGNASANARVHARKRASHNVTAAAARGLDQGRKRANYVPQSDMTIHYAIQDMESRVISEDNIIKFLEELHAD